MYRSIGGATELNSSANSSSCYAGFTIVFIANYFRPWSAQSLDADLVLQLCQHKIFS